MTMCNIHIHILSTHSVLLDILSYLYTLCTHNVYRCYRLYRRCYRLYISYLSWMCIRTTIIFVQCVHVVQLNCVKLKVLSILFYFYLLYNKKTCYMYCVKLTETCYSTCISLLFCWFWLLSFSLFVSRLKCKFKSVNVTKLPIYMISDLYFRILNIFIFMSQWFFSLKYLKSF